MLVISTDDITDVGYYSIWVSYSVPAYPDIFFLQEILYDVQIIHPCLEDNTFRVTTESSFAQVYDFILGVSDEITGYYPTVQNTASVTAGNNFFCGQTTITPQIEMGGDLIDYVPDFMVINADTHSIAIYPTESNQRGTYIVSFQYSLDSYPDVVETLYITTVYVIDVCIDNNQILLGETTHAAYQDFLLGQ